MINGWIMLNKPKGFTSNYCVNFIKKKFQIKKIGYAGTLDPLATGLLPLAIGESTKSIKYFETLDKTYFFTSVWGKETTTLDDEGKIIKSSNIIPSKADLQKIIKKFIGNIEQKPPNYSAIKINGVRAYNLARKGIEFDVKPKKVSIYNIKVVNHNSSNNQTSFLLKCSKGCYVRSLTRDIARELGTFGYCKQIERRRVGIFSKNVSINLDYCLKMKKKEDLKKFLLDIPDVLYHIPQIKLDDNRLELIKNGMKVSMYEELGSSNFTEYLISSSKDIFALGSIKSGYFYPKRVIKI